MERVEEVEVKKYLLSAAQQVTGERQVGGGAGEKLPLSELTARLVETVNSKLTTECPSTEVGSGKIHRMVACFGSLKVNPLTVRLC